METEARNQAITEHNIKDILLHKIEDADMVLVGIGEEFNENTMLLENSREYQTFMQKTKGDSRFQQMLPFLEEIYKKETKSPRIASAYNVLEKLLLNKNYFIISTCMDDFIYDTNLKKEKIVTPCGGYRFLQCEKGCGQKLYEKNTEMLENIMDCLEGDGGLEEIEIPSCPECGSQLVHNNIKAQHYVEEGYLEAWNMYRKWLQGTINHKLCVIELGVGMKYPGIIRWPFEKMVFLNQKSCMFRIHSKLYQLTEEVKERGHKIKEKPIDFLLNRFV